MKSFFLIRYGEISLKGANQNLFLDKLKANIKTQLKGKKTVITGRIGRFYLSCESEYHEDVVAVLKQVPGIVAFSPAIRVEKDKDKILEAAMKYAERYDVKSQGKLFKAEVRRIDKSFEPRSYDMACALGGVFLDKYPDLKVDVRCPDWTINLEIREEAYLYAYNIPGIGGLPVGCAGRGMLLLSGGIDSPVAGYLMARRGLHVDAIYFHTHPFTSEKSLDKVKALAKILSRYVPRLKLHVVPFTELQVKIKQEAPPDETTLLSRAVMMWIADRIAKAEKGLCLITGESLSQVASQTPESLRFTGSTTDLPILRPLIGLDKQQIIAIANQIQTYETSIQPHPDCCTLFAPAHPVIRPKMEPLQESLDKLQINELVIQTIKKTDKQMAAEL
ncbi:MAG: tRNA 4-thiouridine(8) synthase ThiI [Spirochaetales bacterium]|nr:tRNA 4-thiouridine(8) synthase ThiI [Spirochaetales bacterium]